MSSWEVDLGGPLKYSGVVVTSVRLNLNEDAALYGEFLLLSEEHGKNLGPIEFKVTAPSDRLKSALSSFLSAVGEDIVTGALPVGGARELAKELESRSDLPERIPRLGE